MVTYISNLAVPVLVALIVITGLLKGVKLFDVFLEGAKDGIKTVGTLLPILIGLVVAVGVFKECGAMEFIANLMSPVLEALNVPKDLLPLLLLRPISGSASIAMVSDIIKSNGPDSYAGKSAAAILGSTETAIYCMAIYFGAIKIKNTRFTLPAALAAQIAAFVAVLFLLNY